MRILVSLLVGAMLVSGCSSGDADELASGNTQSISKSPAATKPTTATRWGVVGVHRSDRLNVRRQARATARVLGRLAPTATDLKVGRSTSGAWRQIRIDEGVGWAHGRYLAQLGDPVDVTVEARAIGVQPGRRQLARKVAVRQAGAGDGPLHGPVLVARKGATFTFDVLGYADDAVRGERFVVVVVPGEAGFEVSRASATPICARAVSAGGLCS